jgi:hypothetical protein
LAVYKTSRLAPPAGGAANVASGNFSAVAGGWTNTAAGAFSFVGGGSLNTAAGASSVALGSHGAASHDRSGVFGFSGEPCASAGAETAKFCATEVYVNGLGAERPGNEPVRHRAGQLANDTAQLDTHATPLATQAVSVSVVASAAVALPLPLPLPPLSLSTVSTAMCMAL